jgi:hypothetical protein
MEEQSSGEFTSANPAAGAQDAAVQGRRLRAEVCFKPRRRLQHVQRPTSSHFSPNASHTSRRGDACVARSSRCRLTIREVENFRALSCATWRGRHDRSIPRPLSQAVVVDGEKKTQAHRNAGRRFKGEVKSCGPFECGRQSRSSAQAAQLGVDIDRRRRQYRQSWGRFAIPR